MLPPSSLVLDVFCGSARVLRLKMLHTLTVVNAVNFQSVNFLRWF